MKIIADFSGVFGGGLPEVAQLVIDRYGHPAGGRCWRRFSETSEEFDELLRGKISEKEYLNVFFEKGSFPFGKERLSEIFSQASSVAIPGTLSLYKRITAYPRRMDGENVLARERPELIIAVDHIKECLDGIRTNHRELFSLVKRQLWSCDLGRLKRDPGYFPDLLQKLNLYADEVVYIDDSMDNVRAAKEAGITSINYVSYFQLDSSLRNLGFKINSLV